MSKFFRKFIKKIKGPWPETSTGARMNPRTSLICGGLALVVMGLAAARVTYSLYDIQIKNGDTYRQLAAKQQLLDTTIKATRGEIYDTSGITLASTSVVWTIWADPDNSKILYTTTGKDEETVRTLDTAMCAEVSRELTLRLLSGDGESLDAVDTSSEAYQTQYQKVYDALSKTDTKYQVLATKVNNAVKLSIESYVSQFNKAHKRATETSRKGNISVGSEKSFQRNYPYGAFAAAVLGFTDADGIGTYGLEKSYQSTLAGVDGRTITQRNAYGNAIADENATTFAAKDGSNLVLSLDVNVQEIVERYLNEAIAANTVENRGCAIEMCIRDRFSIVQFDLPGARVLDLYAGSGQLGIEALSRGAARCVFLDENREAVNIIMRNCKACGVFDRSRVNIGEAARYLSACREQFDIVLLDPPFRNGTLEKILPAVDKCTAPGGIVLCESETGIVLPAEAGGLTLKKQYKYGRVLLWKYTKPMQNTDPAENEPKGEAL